MLATLLVVMIATVLLTGWALWPSFRSYSIRHSVLADNGPGFWWPKSWHADFDVIQALVTTIKEERGVGMDGAQCKVNPRIVEDCAKGVKEVHCEATAVPLLIDLLQDKRQTTAARMLVVLAIGELGPKASDAVPALIAVLQDSADDVPAYRRLPIEERTKVEISQGAVLRYFTAYALGTMGEAARPAVPALEKGSSDPDSLVGELALRTLKRMDAPQKPPRAAE